MASHRRLLTAAALVLALLCLMVLNWGGIPVSSTPPSISPEAQQALHDKIKLSQENTNGNINNNNNNAPATDGSNQIPVKFRVFDSDSKQKPARKEFSLEDLQKNIDLNQAQFLDFLTDEEGSSSQRSPYGIFGGSLSSFTESKPFDIVGTWERVHQYGLKVQTLSYERSDFVQLARRVRACLIAYTVLHEKPSLMQLLAASAPDRAASVSEARKLLKAELNTIIDGVTSNIFSWISPAFKSIKDIQNHFLGKKVQDMGIVITTGQWHFELAAHAILTLREVLNCTLPIEVQYMGENDLTANMRAAFNSMPDVKTVDVLQTFSTSNVNGWAVKPFSILASGFRNVIFMDADALFFQNPETMLRSSAIFSHFGQLFYHDRSLFKNGNTAWFRKINPQMTHYASTLRYLRGLSVHEMESGVVAVDKGRAGVLHALMMVCQMNSFPEREVTYKNMHGDKESFWMAWDMIRVPYKFVPTFGGTVGYKNEKGNICGGLFHTDEHQRPLWWNGGVLANKHYHKDSGFMHFEYAAFDTDGDNIEWEWETETSPFCLKPRYPEREIVALTDTERDYGARYVQLYLDLREKGWPEYFVKKYKAKIVE